jgi:beta-phosphoglucomutase-like phosphatase (HAD superfamily)
VTDPTVAVLDIDGTLIDSNYQHALAWYRALRSVGEIYPLWRLHRLIGMGGDQVVMAVGGEDLERRLGDQAREQQGKEVDALLEEMAPLPGARDLLVAIRTCTSPGCWPGHSPTCGASSATRAEAESECGNAPSRRHRDGAGSSVTGGQRS